MTESITVVAEGGIIRWLLDMLEFQSLFSDGDAREWFQRFEICQWDGAKKALKLPTLLEGDGLAIWLKFSMEQKADYAIPKEQLIAKMVPTEFVSLKEFCSRKLRPGEAITLYLYDLKRLLHQAMPEMEADVSNPLFLHQFLSGLPTPISRQLCVTGDRKELDAVVQRAKVLMTVSEQEQAAAMHTVQQSPREVDDLKMQITELTEQVAALTAQQKSAGHKCCFYCNKLGHTQRNYPGRPTSQRCYICNRPGHLARQCWQGNGRGMFARGNRHPRYQ